MLGMRDYPAVIANYIYEAIAHGDDEHRAWLRSKADQLGVDIAKLLPEED